MGKMKNLYIDIVNSTSHQKATEAERQKILKEWWETDEYKKLKEKINQNKDANK
jgi:hypothetical protein